MKAKFGTIEVPEIYNSAICLELKYGDSTAHFNSSISDKIALRDGWEVRLKEGCPFIVALNKEVKKEDEITKEGVEAIEKAVDVLSLTYNENLMAESAEQKRVVIKKVDNNSIVQIFCRNSRGAEAKSNVNLENPLEWHKSLRYYRRAQNSENSFDAYRNIYLAFELLLSEVLSFENFEKESVWLNKALEDVSKQTNLKEIVNRDDQRNYRDIIFQDHYVDIRCKINHSKKGQENKEPFNLEHKGVVEKRVKELSRIVRHLISNLHEIDFRKGIMTVYGFEFMQKRLGYQREVLVLGESLDAQEDEGFKLELDEEKSNPHCYKFTTNLSKKEIDMGESLRLLAIQSKSENSHKVHWPSKIEMLKFDSVEIEYCEEMVNEAAPRDKFLS